MEEAHQPPVDELPGGVAATVPKQAGPPAGRVAGEAAAGRADQQVEAPGRADRGGERSDEPGRTSARPPRGGGAGLGRLAATVQRLRGQLDASETTADARALIGLATGILMERLSCGPAAAAEQLDRLARGGGLPLLEIAAELVNQVSKDTLARAASGYAAALYRDDVISDPEGVGNENEGGSAGGDRSRSRSGHGVEAGGGVEARGSLAGATAQLRTAQLGALNAADVQTVAHSLLEHALAPLGATAVAVWALAADGSLVLAGHRGFSTADATRWRHVPPGVSTLARRALVERRGLWPEPEPGAAFAPSIGLDRVRAVGAERDPRAAAAAMGMRAVVPAELNGRQFGVLEVCWPGPVRELSLRVRRQIAALAELCAHTLDTGTRSAPGGGDPAWDAPATALEDLADSLLDPALVLEPLHDARGLVADFRITHANEHFVDLGGRPRAAIVGLPLLEAYPLAAAAGGLFDKVEHVYATGEPFRSGHLVLSAFVDQIPVSAVATVGVSRFSDAVLLTWRIEDQAARLAALLHHAQRLVRIGGFEENLVTGETTWNSELFALYGLPDTAAPIPLRRLPAHTHPDDANAVGRFLRTVMHRRSAASVAFRLQRGDGVLRYMRVVAEPVLDADGAPIAVRGACQDVSAQHWTEIALAATRDQLAQTEQQAAERSRLALQLQHAIVPPAPVPIEASGLQIAVRYRPAETEHLIGGDWYDAVVLADGSVLLCVGDVAGHGVEAATDMVALRNALRGLAATGAGPAQLLSWLNTVTHQLADNVTATAVCGLYEPASKTLRWARAGHLPPLLVRDGQASTLPPPAGILLGAVPDAQYEEAELLLQPGDMLLMYTDGLIERRDSPLDASLGDLLATARIAAPSLSEHLDHLLIHSNADTDDDTCLVGIRQT